LLLPLKREQTQWNNLQIPQHGHTKAKKCCINMKQMKKTILVWQYPHSHWHIYESCINKLKKKNMLYSLYADLHFACKQCWDSSGLLQLWILVHESFTENADYGTFTNIHLLSCITFLILWQVNIHSYLMH
jgi:hypothetical protein